jgi:hypothetical protein
VAAFGKDDNTGHYHDRDYDNRSNADDLSLMSVF